MANRSVNLDGIEAKGAVPCRDHDRLVGKCQAGGDAIGHADADAAEGARIEHHRRA